jgi:8-oxo-dGTP pyrophosphatase MutT (NUDIX family)
MKSPRLAVRAVIVKDGRVLLVNAWPDGRSDLMCAPGGGVEPGSALPDNLRREVYEETGLTIRVGDPCLINEFHDPDSGFHQVDLFFRCEVVGAHQIDPNWKDPEKVVTRHKWVSPSEMDALPFKPSSLRDVAFGLPGALSYDALERIVT